MGMCQIPSLKPIFDGFERVATAIKVDREEIEDLDHAPLPVLHYTWLHYSRRCW